MPRRWAAPPGSGHAAFEEIRAVHERLNQALVAGPEPSASAVEAFFRLAHRRAPEITSTEERNELRYLMRLWGSYLAVRGTALPELDLDPPGPPLLPAAQTPKVSDAPAARRPRDTRRAGRMEPAVSLLSEPAALFLEHLGWIEKVAAMTCNKQGVWGAEAEDFTAWVKMKLVEDDYAAIRRFGGNSEMKTYLAAQVVRQYHDYLRERLGRWRPSAAAERLGPVARDLEVLVRRDGYRLEQAGEKLRTAGRTTLSDAELARLLARLPSRAPLRPVEVAADAALLAAQAPSRADEGVVAAETDARRGEVMGALGRALERLEPEERLIVQMHFAEGCTLADVARALRLEQKPLYRRVERLRRQLKGWLESEGVRWADVHGVLGEEGAV